MILQKDTTIGGVYRLEKRLGRGGMGEVWLAQHLLLNEKRAIKVMLEVDKANPELRERFIQGEARNALRLSNHPNIVRVYELGLHQEIPFIVMEYIEGGEFGVSLSDFLRFRRPGLEEAGIFLRQVATALDYAHQQGVIHRDVKPANILLSTTHSGWVARLNDFGLTKDLEADTELTGSSVSMGSPAYMSPEQARGKAGKSSDIYSLGCVLYEMLTGRTPFLGNALSLLMQHSTDIPPSPRNFNSEIPVEVVQVVLQSLAKLPEERFTSAWQMAQAYWQALRGTTSHSETTLASVPSDHLPTSYLPSSPLGSSTPAGSTSRDGETSSSDLPTTALPDIALIPKNNLPAPTTSFIGREAELAQARLLLENTRLLTLTGAGGTGKTRLAIELARQLQNRFREGVWLVELAALTDPQLVVQAFATVLEIKEESGKSLLASVNTSLQNREILLVVDNCEHLIAECARIVEALLRACPRLKVLATSREVLAISGETSWRVPSLGLPDPQQLPALEKLTQYEAVKLFIARAVAVLPAFTVTNQNAPALAQICYQLDGIPLALELAAVRVRSMTVEQIQSRLDNRFKLLTGGSRTALPRQQTLRALLDWSYELLSEAEKVLLSRLSIFGGGWDLAAAEQICQGEYEQGELFDFEVVDLLDQLVAKSLVVAEARFGDDEQRFYMLETIRHYSQEKLKERASLEMEQLQVRHSEFYLVLAEQAELELVGAEQAHWLSVLDRNYDNLRLAMERSSVEITLRIGSALWRFWSIRGYLSEGRKRLELALAKVNMSEVAEEVLAKALKATGTLCAQQFDQPTARHYFEKGLELYRKLGDQTGLGSLLNNLAGLAREEGDLQAARPLYSEALKIFEALSNQRAVGAILNNLGMVARDQQDYASARGYLEEGLALTREQGDKALEALLLSSLGDIALFQEDYLAAQQFLGESLQLNRELGDDTLLIYLLEYFGSLAVVKDKPLVGLRLVEAAGALRLKFQTPLPQSEQAILEKRMGPARQVRGEAANPISQEGREKSLEELVKLISDSFS